MNENDAVSPNVPPNESADQPPNETEDLALAIPMAAIVPLAIGVVVAMIWAFGADWVLAPVIPFVVLLSAITVIDLRELRVPNRLLLPAAILAVPLLGIGLASSWSEISIVRAFIGAAIYGGIYFVIFFIYPPGMGFGDVKLAPLIGAQLGFFGWTPLVRSLLVSHLISGLVAILVVLAGLLSRGRLRGKAAFAFAPFMAIGAIVALVLEGFSGS